MEPINVDFTGKGSQGKGRGKNALSTAHDVLIKHIQTEKSFVFDDELLVEKWVDRWGRPTTKEADNSIQCHYHVVLLVTQS